MNDILTNAMHVQKVKDEHEKGLVLCLQKIHQWNKFKRDYEVLQERLQTLPDKLSYDIMVPFGSRAFMPGSMVHTNKITVLLGDNWFADVSAKQASEIAGRRLKQCNKMLQDLHKEKQQFENWLGYISEMTCNDYVEITEEYDPEKEKLWREQHSKNVQEHRRKLAEQKGNSANEEPSKSEVEEEENKMQTLENYFAQFNESEDEDELDDTSSEDEADEDVNVESQSPADTNENCTQSKVTDSVKPKVVNKPSDHNVVQEKRKALRGQCMAPSNNDNDQRRHVRWIDLSEARSKRITFTHTVFKSNNNNGNGNNCVVNNNNKKKNRRRRRSSSTSEVEEEEVDFNAPLKINSPSDIYKCFSFSQQYFKPKSILKSVNSISSVDNAALSSNSASCGNILRMANRNKDGTVPGTKPLNGSIGKVAKCEETVTVSSGEVFNQTVLKTGEEVPTSCVRRKDNTLTVGETKSIVAEKETVDKVQTGNAITKSVVTRNEIVEADQKEAVETSGTTAVVVVESSDIDKTAETSNGTKSDAIACSGAVSQVVEHSGVQERNGIISEGKHAFGARHESSKMVPQDNCLEKAFTGEVCERVIDSISFVDNCVKSRPKSLFKSARSTR